MEFIRTTMSTSSIFQSDLSFGISLFTLILATTFTTLYYITRRDYGVPPGPTGIPILGYLPFIDSEKIHLQTVKLKNQYGEVFSFRILGKLFINLASVRVLREAHITKSDCFKERSSDYNILKRVFKDGIAFSQGEKWRTVRKYFVSELKERGMTIYKENTAEVIDETIDNFIQDLKKRSGRPTEIIQLLTDQCILIIRQTLLGLNTPVSKEEIDQIQEDYKIVTTLFNPSSMFLHGIIAKYLIAPFQPCFKHALKVHTDLTERLQNMIDNHRRTFNKEDIRDIIDAYLLERCTRKENGDPTYKYFSDQTLISNLLMFIGDGVVNVATFVTVMIMALLDHPEEQDKIHQELVDVCGKDRNPGMADKSKLSYLNAFLLEAQRTANLFPPFPSLECTKETTVGGYRIPKGAITVTNVYAIHNDHQVYENPEKFNPSRFLLVGGKAKEDSPITFGIGKRVCIGESFVLMQSFVFIAALVKHFRLAYSTPKTLVEMTMSRTLDVCLTPRK